MFKMTLKAKLKTWIHVCRRPVSNLQEFWRSASLNDVWKVRFFDSITMTWGRCVYLLTEHFRPRACWAVRGCLRWWKVRVPWNCGCTIQSCWSLELKDSKHPRPLSREQLNFTVSKRKIVGDSLEPTPVIRPANTLVQPFLHASGGEIAPSGTVTLHLIHWSARIVAESINS